LDYHPGYGQFALLYARLQMENGDNNSAIAVMEKALQEQQQPADFYAYLAAIYQHSKDYAKSIAAYQRALNLKPQQSVWWMGIGISLEGAGKTNEAITAYHEALDSGGLTPKLQDFVKGRLQGLE
jgi:MSHA biogenesis protein MshN